MVANPEDIDIDEGDEDEDEDMAEAGDAVEEKAVPVRPLKTSALRHSSLLIATAA